MQEERAIHASQITKARSARMAKKRRTISKGVAMLPRPEAWGRLRWCGREIVVEEWKGELRCDVGISWRCLWTKWADILMRF